MIPELFIYGLGFSVGDVDVQLKHAVPVYTAPKYVVEQGYAYDHFSEIDYSIRKQREEMNRRMQAVKERAYGKQERMRKEHRQLRKEDRKLRRADREMRRDIRDLEKRVGRLERDNFWD